MHGGARPEPRKAPPYLVSLGRTVGIPANGAVSNLNFTPHGVATLGRAVREGDFDVAGATDEEVEPYLLEREGVDVLGRVSEDEKWRRLHEADLVCAPSLGG